MRAIWKGHIRFSLVTIPIQIFSAINSKGNISFKQIHEKDNGSIGYKKYCKLCEEVVNSDDIVKGFEYENDQYVVFTEEELDNISLKSTRSIDIEAFVDITEVHPSRFEAVYYIGPDGDIALDTYSLFCQTLLKSGKAGIGRIILRDREDLALLTPHKDGLIMYKLRYPNEIRSIQKVPGIKPLKTDIEQMKLAMTLVDSLTMSFQEVDFSDRYQNALMELVNKKIEGKEILVMDDDEENAPVVDIMSALKKSIEKAKEKKASA